jgi:hypothetical protein
VGIAVMVVVVVVKRGSVVLDGILDENGWPENVQK